MLNRFNIGGQGITEKDNINKDKLDAMLNSEKAQLWNNIIPDFCSDCDLYSKCMAGCRAASEQMNFSLNEVDPIVKLAGCTKP